MGERGKAGQGGANEGDTAGQSPGPTTDQADGGGRPPGAPSQPGGRGGPLRSNSTRKERHAATDTRPQRSAWTADSERNPEAGESGAGGSREQGPAGAGGERAGKREGRRVLAGQPCTWHKRSPEVAAMVRSSDKGRGFNMLVGTTWKARALSPEQVNRMMATWGKLEASLAENPSIERVCWYITADATAGILVDRVIDADAAAALNLEAALALGEFLEFDSRIVLDLEAAMPAILKGVEHINS